MKSVKAKSPFIPLLAVLILSSIILFAVGQLAKEQPALDKIEYKVERGDSLWSIASKYCPDDMKMWDYIDTIIDENGLLGKTIHPGQILLVFKES